MSESVFEQVCSMLGCDPAGVLSVRLGRRGRVVVSVVGAEGRLATREFVDARWAQDCGDVGRPKAPDDPAPRQGGN